MDKLHRRAAVLAVVAVVLMGAAACGSSSSSKTTAKTPATPSTPATPRTPSTTNTTATSGPLTLAAVKSITHAFNRALNEWGVSTHSGDLNKIQSASSKLAGAANQTATQLEALKAPSPAASSAVSKYVSLIRQDEEWAAQLSKAGSVGAANPLIAKIDAQTPKIEAAQNELAATVK
jgi:hypothetical protein